MLGIVSRVAIAAGTGVITTSKTVQGAVNFAGAVVGGTFQTAADTVNSVHKVISVGNHKIHDAAERYEMKRHYDDGMLDLKLQTQRRTALIEYGEETEKLKERYNNLPESMKELLAEKEQQFSEFNKEK